MLRHSIKLTHADLTYRDSALDDKKVCQLKHIIAKSFADIDVDAYFEYYFEQDAKVKRRLRLFFLDCNIVGYCLLTFDDSHHHFCLVGASAAFLPEHRGQNSTFAFSLSEVFKYYLRNPLRRVLYADTMLSPAMFRAMAKNIAQVYPNQTPPDRAIAELYNEINSEGLISAENGLRCLKAVGRKTNYSNAEIARFRESQKAEIALYCRVNPNFDKGIALVTIIPITFTQFVLTLKKMIWRAVFQK
ncbi:hypothetical protein [Pseudoalteromonas peptidolytica]|uniref:Uncharacterized protein n=1 Tax=Pseudoalteromonas peptidolytica F12-50-A1 TaxID=1315280 RepID=A0A8I0MXR9_9GAMM|nr:hypothetical protein [Pseudoalteromonas peptidolytica]MBE0347781.1 hypothetical protein [Pseudoalteromonas peptidolytica F12-50-A1]GEK09712.1 hypothetical protein PPE03_19610 [Pseudoalteromonas peptidolytica]